jgi:hypothetical protein
MTRKKSKSNQAKVAARRLVEDEEVQKQLRMAALRVREAWGRASGRPASKSLSDKKVYAKVREAATSLVTASRRLRRQPEPPKRTGRKVVVGAAVAGGAAYALKKKRAGGSEFDGQTVVDAPVAAPTPPIAVA